MLDADGINMTDKLDTSHATSDCSRKILGGLFLFCNSHSKSFDKNSCDVDALKNLDSFFSGDVLSKTEEEESDW